MFPRALVLSLSLAIVAAGACARCGAPELPDAVALPPGPPAAAVPAAPDAAPDVLDARADTTAAGPRAAPPPARRPAAPDGGGLALRVGGSLPRKEAERVVRAGIAKIRACNPGLAGRVTFRLTVDERGRVSLGEVVTSTLGGGDPEMCMVRAARDLKFPPASSESTVTFQLIFGSR